MLACAGTETVDSRYGLSRTLVRKGLSLASHYGTGDLLGICLLPLTASYLVQRPGVIVTKD